MKLLTGFNDAGHYRGGFVAIGNFDGVHRGHQSMISRLVERSRADQVPAVVLTFDPHPITLLRPDLAPPSLSTVRRKAELLGQCGVDYVIAYPTDQEFLALAPEDFFQKFVKQRLDARGMVEGPNFFFGRDRRGDIKMLRALCAAGGLTLDVVPSVEWQGELVSSSKIRSLIADGRLAEAVELLGHPYRVSGIVQRGADRGGKIGFPTANLGEVATLLPADGVYGAVAQVDGVDYPAAVNLGPNPTFGEKARKFEAHLLDYSGDLYERELAVDFLARLREVRTFDSVDELQQQVSADLNHVRTLAKTWLER